MNGGVRALLTASVVSMPFTLVHAVEDFAFNVHEARFGVPLLPAAFALSLGYAAQSQEPAR